MIREERKVGRLRVGWLARGYSVSIIRSVPGWKTEYGGSSRKVIAYVCH